MNGSAQLGSMGPVVVGCDGSWPGAQAVITATGVARRRGVPLTLLVVEQVSQTADGATTRSAGAAERAAAVAESARMRARATDRNVITEVLVVPNVADRRVEELAGRASLLVLGAYGGGGQVAMSLGSTSDALARLFHCPILLPHARAGESLRAGTRPPTVVAAVSRDGSAADVVAAAAREAAERHSPLLVLHAVSLAEGAAVATEHDWLAGVVASVGVPSWLPHRSVVTVGDPVAAVIDRVQPDDLLVLATRGEGRLAGIVRGSVSRALLDAGECDVLVVAHHGAADADGGDRKEPVRSGLRSEPQQVRTPRAVAKLSADECWALVRSAPVGRLAVVVDGRPDIFPVNHVVQREAVLFRTAQGSKLDACIDQPVAYELDGFDTATGDAWSVVIKGTARELRERDDLIRAMRLPITPWQSEPKPRIVQIDPDTGPLAVTGRRFHVFGGVTSVRSSDPATWTASETAAPVPS